MSTYDRLKLVRDCYGAYESGDRRVIEELLTKDFTFYSPADVGIDRARYFDLLNLERLRGSAGRWPLCVASVNQTP
jgi:hypothetical protein